MRNVHSTLVRSRQSSFGAAAQTHPHEIEVPKKQRKLVLLPYLFRTTEPRHLAHFLANLCG
jgi:hypothetical protein